METPVDTQLHLVAIEHCLPDSATQVVPNETNGFLEGDLTQSRAKPSEEATINHKQGASKTSLQKPLSTTTSSCNGYSGYYADIFSYIVSKKFPLDAAESLKRMIKRSSQNYCVIDGVLHYGHKNPKKVVSEKEEQRKILARAHIEKGTGVHRGAKKMYEFINSTMFWRFLYVDITNYIKECMKCVDYVHETNMCVADHAEPVKHDRDKTAKIWEKIDVQILGPYPKTANQNEFVVTIVDPVSQWIIAQPIAFDSSLASQVACLIFKTFCDFGFTKCTISSVPPQISSDILCKLRRYEDCMHKVTAALGVPVGAAQICNIVKCQDETVECSWLSKLFSTWVQDNPCTWDKDLDEFLFEFRALPKNGAPSPFLAMFGRQPVQWTENDKENVFEQGPCSVLPKRRKLQGSVMKCRHCDELFTSKMSFRIHQRKHTEEAKQRGLMEGEEPFKNLDHENNDDDNDNGSPRVCRSTNQSPPDTAAGSLVNVWKRLKKISKGRHSHVGKPQLRDDVQKQLRANAVAAVKDMILATKDSRKKRGKYQKYTQDVQDEMARYAIQHGILKTTVYFSERLGVRVSHSTVRNIVKLHCCFTPQLKEEIGRFAAGFGVEAASRHFSERLGRDVRQGLVRKFKKLYVGRFSDTPGKPESVGQSSSVCSKHKSVFNDKLKEEIGKHACEAGIASTVKFFFDKHSLCLKESLIRRFRKMFIEKNKPPVKSSVLSELNQQKQNVNTCENAKTLQGCDNAAHSYYTAQQLHSIPHVQTNNNLSTQQTPALHFSTVNNTNNSTGFLSYHEVPSSSTASVIVNQDSVSLPIFQQPEQTYSSVSHQGHIIQSNMITVPSSLTTVPHSHFQFQPPVVTTTSNTVARNNERVLQPDHHFQHVSSSSAITTEATVAEVHLVPSLPHKQQTQTDSNSSIDSIQHQAVIIHQHHQSNTIESSYPATVVQAVSDKVAMLSSLDSGSATLMADKDGTYTLATCVPTGEKSLYKPQTFHLPVSHLDTVAMSMCRDSSQPVNDVIITIVPNSEHYKTPPKGTVLYEEFQKVSNNTLQLEKDRQHMYQKQVNKEHAHVIPTQPQQLVEHIQERQSHKQLLHQDQPQGQLQQQVLQLQQPFHHEQEDKIAHNFKHNLHQPQQMEQTQNQQQSLQPQQQVFQLQQQNDYPILQTHQHRQLFVLQPRLPQEQAQKVTNQQSQQHSQQMQQAVLQQSVQIQELLKEPEQHLKKQHMYNSQQQLFFLQPHLPHDQLQKLTHQQNQLQLLQLQHIFKEQPKEPMQHQKQINDHEQQLVQMQQSVNHTQMQESLELQKQHQLHQPQQPLFQIQLHSHQSQLNFTQVQEQQQKHNLHQSQHEVLQLQHKFVQEQPQEPLLHEKEQQQLHQAGDQVLLLQQKQLVQEHLQEPTQENQQCLHPSQHQQLVQQHSCEPVLQENQQNFHHSQHQVHHLQEHLVEKQPLEPLDQNEPKRLHQAENQVLHLQHQLGQEQSQEVLNLQVQFVQEQQKSLCEEGKQNLLQSENQVLEVKHQQLVQEHPQDPTIQQKEQNSFNSDHHVVQLQQQLVQEQQQKNIHEEKNHLQQSEHNVLQLQQQLEIKKSQNSTHQEKEQHLHLQLQQPHKVLQQEHKLHHEHLKMQVSHQQPVQLYHFSHQQNSESQEQHNLHDQSFQSQQHEQSNPKVDQSQQDSQQSTKVSHQNSKKQPEVVHYMKLACTFEEEESMDDPDEMVIYVSDATDNVHEGAVKEQKKKCLANTKKNTNRNKSKLSDSTSHKRGNYTLYSPEIRAELGRYAAEHGNQRAREHFRDILGHDVPESTIRSLRDKYILKCYLNSNAPGGVNSVTSLGYSPRGRPLRLGKYDDIVRECIRDLMQSGEKISTFLAVATAKQVLMQYEPGLLAENGGNIKLTSAWAKSFLRRIGVQHDS